MKNRIDLAKHFNDLGFKKGAEIGVFDGYFSEVLCREIPGLKLYPIEKWECYSGYRDGNYQLMLNEAYETTKRVLSPYDCEIIKKHSVDAVQDFEDESLDFVYIDANHNYEFVKEDIEAWTPKVRKGGIVSGHDYYITKSGNSGVVDAVDEYVGKHGYELKTTPWYNKNKRKSRKDNWQPSWYFTKK